MNSTRVDNMKINKASLYICWMQDGEWIKKGPYHTITPQGCGLVTGENWITYEVQTENLEFQRLTVPYYYHSIFSYNI